MSESIMVSPKRSERLGDSFILKIINDVFGSRLSLVSF
jgi:hypothetical protein